MKNRNQKHVWIITFILIFDILSIPLRGQNWQQIVKSVASDRAAYDNFGLSVAISGDYAIVGSPQNDEDALGGNVKSDAGAAYIFKRNGTTWVQQTKIVASDRTAGDNFGASVAISGNYIVVGAYQSGKDATGNNIVDAAGAAYIFRLTAADSWVQESKIVAPIRAEFDYFGLSVDISNNYVVIGALFEDEDATNSNTKSNAGSAYIFKRNGTTWTQEAKIVASDRAVDDNFGGSVSISGDYVLVGAASEDEDATNSNTKSDAGSAYIFKRNGTTWAQEAKIVASDRDVNDVFGLTVDIDGDYAVVGAYAEDEDVASSNTKSGAGSAYVFKRNGTSWTQEAKIVASDRDVNDGFGLAVAISGDYVVVGAYQDDEDAAGVNTKSNSGSAYIFKRSGTTWRQESKIVASDRAEDDSFAQLVAINGSYIIVGAFQEDEDATGGNMKNAAGSVYFFAPFFPIGLPTCLEDDFLQLKALYNATDGNNWLSNNNWLTSSDMQQWSGVALTSDGCDILTISLDNNQLTGTIPNLSLPKLQTLSLRSNQLTGTIPNFSLPALQSLLLDDNQLTGTIPNFSLQYLYVISLDNNQLTGTIPNFSLPALQSLYLNNNQLTGSCPNFNSPNLLVVEINNNQLTDIPNFNLQRLIRLSLYNNQLSIIPNNFNLPRLEELYLHDNQLNSSIPSLNLPNLRNLHLQNNQLTGNIPTNLNLPRLSYLNLQNNQLSGTVPNFNSNSIIALNLQNNQLTGLIPNFNSTILSSVIVSNNKFVFGNLEDRTWLNIYDVRYSPQAKIPILYNGSKFTVSTGAADNVQSFQWYKDNVLIATTQSSQYQPTTNGTYYCKVSHNTLTIASNNNYKNLVLQSEDYILATVPVELLSFTAKNEGAINYIIWQTATEINSSDYDIERSTDGKIFQKIGETKAQGKAADYEYIDRYPLSTTTYYRLKVNDLDGKSSYSNIVSLSSNQKRLMAKAYPNPCDENLTIEITTHKNSDVMIELIDIFGRLIYQSKVIGTEGVINMPISTKHLPNGSYFLKVFDGQMVIQQKIEKQ